MNEIVILNPVLIKWVVRVLMACMLCITSYLLFPDVWCLHDSCHIQPSSCSQNFTYHFDTRVGPKISASSYSSIAETLGIPTPVCLFFTDAPLEARAARTAGMQAVLVVRPGNARLNEEDLESFVTISTFMDVNFSSASKGALTHGESSKENEWYPN